jgi:Pyruvate/2-oxoacid:ferredoxin oxidoreductase delta subunit
MKLPFVRPSTLDFIGEALDADDYTWRDLLHGYIYARWPYLYIGIGVGEHPLAKTWLPRLERLTRPARRFVGWLIPRRRSRRQQPSQPQAEGQAQPPAQAPRLGHAAGYHGKVVPLESARRLVLVNEDIRLPDLEQVIPYPRARALILKNPDHIAVLECPCRAARPNPCLPLDVCLIVGEPFASFVVEHHPDKARRITQAEAARILEEEDARGHVHHAFFKDAMLGRFYAICNCCACCCGAMQSQRNGTPMLASSGYVCRVDEALCIGCGECQAYCQFDALSLVDYHSQVDEAACMGCGVCVSHCEQGALALEREASKGLPLELRELVGA